MAFTSGCCGARLARWRCRTASCYQVSMVICFQRLAARAQPLWRGELPTCAKPGNVVSSQRCAWPVHNCLNSFHFIGCRATGGACTAFLPPSPGTTARPRFRYRRCASSCALSCPSGRRRWWVNREGCRAARGRERGPLSSRARQKAVTAGGNRSRSAVRTTRRNQRTRRSWRALLSPGTPTLARPPREQPSVLVRLQTAREARRQLFRHRRATRTPRTRSVGVRHFGVAGLRVHEHLHLRRLRPT